MTPASARRAAPAALIRATLVWAALAWTVALAVPAPAPAQDRSGGDVEIEAAGGLEWLTEQRLYRARGDVRLRQGDVTLRTDQLTARYRDAPGGGTTIFEATAEGRVTIETPDGRVTADRAVYDLDRDRVVLTGGDLRLETADEVITARDSLEYDLGGRRAVARGDAVVVRGEDRVSADLLTAELAEGGPDGTANGAEDGLSLTRVTASGNVLITTPRGSAAGDEATYDIAASVATLSGSVRLVGDGGSASGGGAEVDLDTGISRLTAPPGGRVRALLSPNP